MAREMPIEQTDAALDQQQMQYQFNKSTPFRYGDEVSR